MIIWDRVWMAVVGLACIGLGLVVSDFRWGVRQDGKAAPSWVGKLWFVGLGVALIAGAFLIHTN